MPTGGITVAERLSDKVSVSQPGRLNFRDVRNLRHHSTQQLRRQMAEPRTSGNCAELSPEYSEFSFNVSCLSPWIFMPFINAFGYSFLAGCIVDLFLQMGGVFHCRVVTDILDFLPNCSLLPSTGSQPPMQTSYLHSC